MTRRELQILKAALEGDIIRQKQSPNAEHPNWKRWLDDTEKLLKKVNLMIFEEESKRFSKKN